MAIDEISLFFPLLQFLTVGDDERFHGFTYLNDLSVAVHVPAVQHPIHRRSASSAWHLRSNNKWMDHPPVGQKMSKYLRVKYSYPAGT